MNLQVKERLEAAIEKYELSKAQVSREVNYSNGVIALYLSGNYKGDTVKLEKGWLRNGEAARLSRCTLSFSLTRYG